MRRLAAVGVSATVLVGLLTGCGSDEYPSYSKAKACSVPAEKISAVVGTDHFATRTKGGPLPLTTQPFFDCSVNLSEEQQDVVAVTAYKLSAKDQASRRKQIAETDEQFTVGRVSAGVKLSEGGFSGYMLCGAVAASVQAGPDRAVSEAERKALVTAVAEAAGCDS
jgi:hypothetical protein